MQLEAIWRTEGPRLVAGLTRLVRDVGLKTRWSLPSINGLETAAPTTPVPG